ncbi:hypothetical protein LIER_24155 [Lithospermum erythrorhizon]|uniref:Uncharacterized protein n=1 Tax=Lithospermum erythrorhizon TaxID=34254 RepID=A0AAV3R351_LITER
MSDKILCWNIRGIGNSPSCRRIKALEKTYKFYLLFIQEPKIPSERLQKYIRNFNFKDGSSSFSNRIWIFWSVNYEVDIVIEAKYYLHVKITFATNVVPFYVTIGHVVSELGNRKELWEGLSNLVNDNLPWFVMGDLNCIVDLVEAMGCKSQKGFEDITNCISDCHLQDAGYIGSVFTWTNGSKFNCIVRHLARTGSDHAPLLIDCRGFSEASKSSFRFRNMWLHHQEFMQILKATLKQWNHDTFGNVFSKVEQAEDEVLREALQKSQADHLRCLAMEEEYWGQISGIRWIKEGDISTAVFHSFVKRRKKKNYIAGTDDTTTPTDAQLMDSIPRLVTQEDNAMLLAEAILEEVKVVVFSIDKHSAAGADGYNGLNQVDHAVCGQLLVLCDVEWGIVGGLHMLYKAMPAIAYNGGSMKVPSGVIDKMEKHFNKFLWGESKNWKTWSKVCKPYEKGGSKYEVTQGS